MSGSRSKKSGGKYDDPKAGEDKGYMSEPTSAEEIVNRMRSKSGGHMTSRGHVKADKKKDEE
jgi:hypothetical protein